MHRLLKRQIKKHFGEEFSFTPEMSEFIQIVNNSYKEFDSQNAQLERTLELSSRESFRELSNFKLAIDSASIVSIADDSGNILSVNENFLIKSGYTREEVIGQNHRILNSGHHSQAFWSEMWQTIASGKIWKGEVKNKSKSGEIFWYDTTIIPYLNNQGKPYQYIAIRSDISQRKIAQAQLLESEAKFRLLIESASDIFYYTDAKGNFTYANDISTSITGYSNSEILKMRFIDMVKPSYRKKVAAFYKKIISDNTVSYFEFPIETKEGKEVWIGQNVQIIYKDGKINGFQAIARNITMVKQAQDQILESKNFLDNVLNALPTPVFVKNKKHEWIFVNDAYCNLTGIPESKIIGKTERDFMIQEDAASFIAADDIQFEHKQQSIKENLFFDAQNKEHTLLTRKSNYVNKAGEEFLITVISDITNIKKNEKEIIDKSQILNAILNNLPVVLYKINDDGIFTQASGKGLERMQITPEQMIGQSALNLYSEELYPSVHQQLKHSIESKASVYYISEGIDKSGHWYFDNFTFKDESEEGGIVGFALDITDRKHAEQMMQESEIRFRSLVQNSTDITTIISLTGEIIYKSPSFYRLFGYEEDEVIGKNLFDFIHPSEVVNTMTNLQRGIYKKGISDPVEFRLRHKNGYYIYIEAVGNNMVEQNGIKGIVVNSRDISERKKSQEQIQNTKEFYEKILNKIPTDIVVFDKNHRYLFANEIAIKDKEKREWVIGHNDYEYCVHYNRDTKIAEKRNKLFEKVKRIRKQLEFEEQLQTPIGNRWMLRRMYPVIDEKNEISNIIGFGLDITERKVTEELLKESEDRLKLAMNSARMGIFDWDISSQTVFWDKSLLELFDLDLQIHTTLFIELEKSIHVSDQKRFSAFLDSAIDNRNNLNDIFRIHTDNSEARFVSLHLKIFENNEGKANRVIGAAYDITESYLAQEKIIKSQSELEEAQHIARLGGWEYDVSLDVLSWTNEMYDIFQISKEKKLTLNEMYLSYKKESRFLLLRKYSEVFKHFKPIELEAVIISKNGHNIDVRTKVLPVVENGKVITLKGTTQDITHEKEIARELKMYTNELERKNKELDQFAYIVSHDLKAPLRGINNLTLWIEEDLEGKMDEGVKANLDLMRNRVNRMEGLINGILQYSRAGRLKTEIEHVVLDHLIDEITQNLAIPENFALDIQKNLPELDTERIALEQVLTNFISNAIKYNDNPKPTIAIRCLRKGKFLEFCIEDNGPGIAPEYHEKIFQIFQTLQARDKVESTGVGLAIVNKIVNDKGGSIFVDSDEGKGSRFYFTWPLNA